MLALTVSSDLLDCASVYILLPDWQFSMCTVIDLLSSLREAAHNQAAHEVGPTVKSAEGSRANRYRALCALFREILLSVHSIAIELRLAIPPRFLNRPTTL